MYDNKTFILVSLDLEIEIDRECSYETAMLHLRDQLHSIASLASPHSTTPRLYVKKTGEPVIDDENYQKLTDKVNSVDFVFKWWHDIFKVKAIKSNFRIYKFCTILHTFFYFVLYMPNKYGLKVVTIFIIIFTQVSNIIKSVFSKISCLYVD